MTTQLTRVQAGGTIEAGNADTQGTVQVARDAIAEQFGADGLTGQLAALTTSLNAVQAGQNGATGTITAQQATAIQTAVQAVQGTMTTIEELKGAEGLSDTVVDAIGILENAWAELNEVSLGDTTVGGITAEEADDIEDVTQEQVDTFRELN